MAVTVETLRGELEEAFRNRAHLYRILLEELEAELGPERAEAVLARAVERRGREVAAGLFAGLAADPQAVGARFLAASPDGGRLYPHDAECRDGAMAIRVHRCPLKEAWRESRLGPERIATLCRIAGAFDRGLFEAAGLTFTNETWSEGRGGGCCWIRLARRGPCGFPAPPST
jgi:hypothetical protein